MPHQKKTPMVCTAACAKGSAVQSHNGEANIQLVARNDSHALCLRSAMKMLPQMYATPDASPVNASVEIDTPVTRVHLTATTTADPLVTAHSKIAGVTLGHKSVEFRALRKKCPVLVNKSNNLQEIPKLSLLKCRAFTGHTEAVSVIFHGTQQIFTKIRESLLTLPPERVAEVATLLNSLEEIHTEVRLIFQSSTEGVVIQNARGEIVRFNNAALDILGLSEEQLLGKTSHDPLWKAIKSDGTPFLGTDHPAMVAMREQRSLRDIVMGLELPSGEQRWISINATPYYIDQEKRVLTTFSDITKELTLDSKNRQIIEAINESAIVSSTDSKGIITFANDKFCEISGYNRNELIGNSHRILNSKLHEPSFFKELWATISQGKSWTGVIQNRNKNGSHYFERTIIFPIKSLDGKIEEYLSIRVDVSELVRQKERMKFILESFGIGLWEFHPKTNELIWDDSMYRLYEINKEDFTGHYHAWENSLSPEAKEAAVFELGLALRGEKEFDTSFEIKTKLLNRKFIGGKGLVFRGHQNEPIGMIGINWDKTKDIETQKLLQTQKRFLDTILNSLPCMVFVKNIGEKHTFRFFNKEGLSWIGSTLNDVIDKSDFDLFPKELAEFYTQKDLEVFKNKKATLIEKEELSTPNGKRWIQTHKVPIFKEDGTPDLLIGISLDITENLRLLEGLETERLKSVHNAKLASLGEMAAGIAHEINNPLAIISGSLPLLVKSRENEEKFLAKVDAIEKSTIRIEKIVKGLKKFSRTSEKSSHQEERLSEILDESLILTNSKFKKASVIMSIETVPDIFLNCDSVEIEQVLVNLLNNACDAVVGISERWVKLKVFLNSDGLTMQVIDSGKRPPPEVIEKIFQPFFTTKPVGQGTGLGLSISRGILEQHEAKIWLNESFSNTCFEINFPAKRVKKRIAA